MREIHVERRQFQIPDEPDAVGYRSISALAIVSLVLGVISISALIAAPMWIIPPIGLCVGVIALRRIAYFAPALIGRKAALVGIALSVTFMVAGPVNWYVHREIVRSEARLFAKSWFDFVANKEPMKAVELSLTPGRRAPLNASLYKEFTRPGENRELLQEFLKRRDVRALLALGDKAVVRYYDTEKQWGDATSEKVYQTYAVTFPYDGEQTTFFVGMVLERTRMPNVDHTFWRISDFRQGVKPKRLGGTGEPV